MPRVPLAPLIGLFTGSAVVLGLLVSRGFVLREHASIMLGALALGWLVGGAWTVATAAEQAGGARKLGAAGIVLILVATLIAAFAPVLILVLWTGTPAR